jgi:hypothetical protein
MPARFPITNFSRGEFGPQLYGRIDVAHYTAGAKQLKNFMVQRYGGVRFRDGFRFVGPIFGDADSAIRLVPFQFSIEQAYILAMRDEVMNVAALGGYVLEEDLEIQSVTYGATTTIEVPFHDMVIGEMVYLTGNTGPAGLNGRFVEIIGVPDADHLELDLDTTGYAALTASTGITRVGAPTPPPAPEPPPPPPPPPPTPPPTGGGGGTGGTGSGSGGGGLSNGHDDYYNPEP